LIFWKGKEISISFDSSIKIKGNPTDLGGDIGVERTNFLTVYKCGVWANSKDL